MPLQDLRQKRTATLWFDILFPLVLFVGSFLLVYRFALVDLDPHHSGWMYKTALDVANGRILFSETVTPYGSLTVYLQALALLIFGKQMTSILLSSAFFYACAFLLLYVITRRILSRALSVTAALLTVALAPFYFWQFHPWSSIYALVFLMLSLWLLQMALNYRDWRTYLLCGLSGLSAALTFWCRQPVGFVTALAGILCLGFLLLLLIRRKTEDKKRLGFSLLAHLGGIVIGTVALLIPIFATGATQHFVYQSLTDMAAFAADRSSAAGGIFNVIGHVLYSLFLGPFFTQIAEAPSAQPKFNLIWLLLPLAALALAFYLLIKLTRALFLQKAGASVDAHDVTLLLYSVFAVAEWHQYYPVACYRHWYWGAFLCLPALLWWLRLGFKALQKHPRFSFLAPTRRQAVALALSLVILFGFDIGWRTVYGTQKLVESQADGAFYHDTYRHLNGTYLSDELNAHYAALFDTLADLQKHYPDKEIVNATDNYIYSLFGEGIYPSLYEDISFYENEAQLLKDHINATRPIVIGPEAPAENYVEYLKQVNTDGDPYPSYHNMPANVYIPAELVTP